MRAVPRLHQVFTRKMGPVGLALTAFDIWRRIPKQQRRQIIAQARKHGPRLAKAAVAKAAVERQRRRRRG
jgi:hypothetical protein